MLIRELTSDDIPRFIEIVKQLSPQASTGVGEIRRVGNALTGGARVAL